MSKRIKSGIEIVKDNIHCLQDECDSLHYEIYACYHRNKLFEYELTLKELDKSYYELENLKQKYNVQLRKEEEKSKKRQQRFYEMFIPQLLSGNHKSNLEKEEIVKGDEIALEINHVEDKNTENQLREDNVLVSDSLDCKEHKTDIFVESFAESVPVVQEEKMADDDIIEVEHIEFIIPEICLNILHRQISFQRYLRTELILLKKCIKVFLVPSQSYMTLAFYKTRGRVFSNKGRMMGNNNKRDIFYLLVANLVICKISFNLKQV